MYRADDALQARQRIEEEALNRVPRYHTEPVRFPRCTALYVFVVVPGSYMDYVVDCELWVDRNIFLREQGINPSKAETATAYWSTEQERFVVTGTKGSLCKTLMRRLGLL